MSLSAKFRRRLRHWSLAGAGLALCTLALATLLGAPAAAQEQERKPFLVLVTIKPLYGLVAAVMGKTGTPTLVHPGNPRARLKAATVDEAALLRRGQVIFWVGPQLEYWLQAPLRELSNTVTVVELLRTDGLRLMEGRAGRRAPPLKRADTRQAKTARQNGSGRRTLVVPRDGKIRPSAPAPKPKRAVRPRNRALTRRDLTPKVVDPHMWLDPRNAIILVRRITRTLSEANPAHAARYRINAARVIVRIETLNAEITNAMRALPKARYVTFDKVYQYFESHYLLKSGNRLRMDPRRQDAASVAAAKGRMTQDGVRCVFASPAYSDRTIRAVAGRGLRLVKLDAYGSRYPADAEAWFRIMGGLSAAIAGCLDPQQRTR